MKYSFEAIIIYLIFVNTALSRKSRKKILDK